MQRRGAILSKIILHGADEGRAFVLHNPSRIGESPAEQDDNFICRGTQSGDTLNVQQGLTRGVIDLDLLLDQEWLDIGALEIKIWRVLQDLRDRADRKSD